MGRTAAVTVGLLLAAVALAISAVSSALSPVNRRAPEQVVVIPPGSGAGEVGRILEEAGIVRRGSHFVYLARLRGVTRRLHGGEYRLSPGMSLPEVVERIARGEVVLHTVTIPEGFTAEQIVQALAAKGLGDPGRLQALVREGATAFPHPFLREIPGGSLEGYLFPDTYQLPRFLDERLVLTAFLDRFGAAVIPTWRREARGRSLHEIVTVAAMVEREARLASERPLIAGVIYNRLRRGWRLEVDATVLYALGRHKPVVTYDDLRVDSPYNTYLHAGLPPGPIANPGLAAIEAALRPARTDYLYYVARPDGSHAFSRTLAEHQAAVRRYRP